jgi:hypothetical protein
MKYIRRSKTVEATMNIRKLFDSSVSYYEADHASSGPGGAILPRQFPTVPATSPNPSPIGGACGKPGDKWDPKGLGTATWNDTSWSALNFSVDDPFYFSYSYTSAGTDTGATFTATANGDLDCDGVFSTYARSGSVLADRSVSGGAGLYTNREIE